MKVLWLFALGMGLGCASVPSNPFEAAKAYRDAAIEGRSADILQNSDRATRESIDEAALKRWLKKNPRLAYEAAIAIGELDGWQVVLRNPAGREIRMVSEDGSWKLAEGGIVLPRMDTPAHSLQSFFFAATGHLELLRELLPAEVRAELQSDFSVGKKLYADRDRIFRARDEIGFISSERFEVFEGRAVLRYGEDKAAVLVVEDGLWRVQDIE